ncbi:hypothetical protein QUB10_26045 [Microcoleus sp. B5-D4]|uniref:hypothetical protein n=1 Tax=unclassified Microcoleus TaxID=2642155 RepID=UPI002FD44CA1
MSGYLLNSGATVICAHGGQAQPIAPNPRVKVMGQPITTQSSPHTIAGCSNPVPPINVGPCIIAQWVSASTRVKAMGQPVLLQDSKSVSIPTGTPLNILVTQTRVKAM